MTSIKSRRTGSIHSFWSEETKIDNDSQSIGQHETTTTLVSSTLPNHFQIIKKVCRRSTESYRDFIKRASSEYCIMSVLSHTNIVNAKDMLMKKYHFELVLNLEDQGIPLSNLIHSSHLDYQQRNYYMYQLLQSIQYLHSLGIGHRDIQLNNILIMPDHTLKLSNFSSSVVFCEPGQMKKKQSYGKVGLLEYQSPETLSYHHHHQPLAMKNKKLFSSLLSSQSDQQQIINNNINNDHHPPYWAAELDIWSLGIVFFYLWEKRFPWSLACSLHDPLFYIYARSHPIYGPDIIPCLQPLPYLPRQLIYRMLNPDPTTRISISSLLNEYHLLTP
ncbi:kinase-like domain-containing protein [Cunninghamella echinulata]|nr:kinase-like domain-containing protein [Cunninghamella echinulata]